MKNKLFILIGILILSVNLSFAQGEGNIWYFGANAGLDFNSVPVQAITNGALNTDEGVASISSPTGSLLFYTDGLKVYNSLHQTMFNGTGLDGHISSTQSAIIVPKPFDTTTYYIFTVYELAGWEGLRYSEVDMTLDGGLGGITTNKNIPLASPVCEKISAVRHNNIHDFWVVTHGWNSNSFYSFLVDSTGVNTSVITSNSGATHQGNSINTVGYMKVAPSGDKLALVNRGSTSIDLFEFDNTTGTVLPNPIEIPSIYSATYGIEFSPNGEYLYVGWSVDVVRYNLTLPAAQIPSSMYTLINSIAFTGTNSVRALQVGPDGNIYVCLKNYNHLAQIINPSAGADSLNVNGVYLDGRHGIFGLPTFIQSYFEEARIIASGQCTNEEVHFYLYNGESVVGADWNFGDSISGADNFSTLLDPTHIYTLPGTYNISAVLSYLGFTDTVYISIEIYETPEFTLGNDTLVPINTSIVLELDPNLGSFQWSTGESTNSIIASQPGLYSVTVSNQYECYSSDEIIIDWYNNIEGENIQGVLVYPNPCKDNFILETNLESPYSLSIYNAFGQLVQMEKSNDKNLKVNLSKQTSGIYYLKIESVDSKKTIKLIKH